MLHPSGPSIQGPSLISQAPGPSPSLKAPSPQLPGPSLLDPARWLGQSGTPRGQSQHSDQIPSPQSLCSIPHPSCFSPWALGLRPNTQVVLWLQVASKPKMELCRVPATNLRTGRGWRSSSRLSAERPSPTPSTRSKSYKTFFFIICANVNLGDFIMNFKSVRKTSHWKTSPAALETRQLPLLKTSPLFNNALNFIYHF